MGCFIRCNSVNEVIIDGFILRINGVSSGSPFAEKNLVDPTTSVKRTAILRMESFGYSSSGLGGEKWDIFFGGVRSSSIAYLCIGNTLILSSEKLIKNLNLRLLGGFKAG